MVCLAQSERRELSLWLAEPDVISSFKRQQEWWTLLVMSPIQKKSDKEVRVGMKRHMDSFHDKVHLDINRPKVEKGGEYQGLRRASES